MNESLLIELIECGDLGRCAAFFNDMAEADRRALVQTAFTQYRAMHKAFWSNLNKSGSRRRLLNATGAVMATGNLTTINKMNPSDVLSRELCVFLNDRRPAWLQDWANGLLNRFVGAWGLVWCLDQAGACVMQICDNRTYGFMYSGSRMILEEGLFFEDDIWRFFEVEGTSDHSMTSHDLYEREPAFQWRHLLPRLVEEGRLSRTRLLRASLEALNRDFAQYRAGWFSRFHEQLNPSLEERVVNHDLYLDLFHSSIPPTVTFAVKAAVLLEKAGGLDAEGFLQHVDAVFRIEIKATLKKALNTVKRIIRRCPDLETQALTACLVGLSHTAAEVQEGVLALLEASAGDEALKAEAARYEDAVAPSLKARLMQWLGDQAVLDWVEPEDDWRQLVARAQQVSLEDSLDLARVIGCVEQAESPPAIPAMLLHQRRYRPDALKPVTPLADLEAVVGAFTVLIEQDAPTYLEAALALDGLSRFANVDPDQFPIVMGPLVKRARQLAERSNDALIKLVAFWLHKHEIKRGPGIDSSVQTQLEIYRRLLAQLKARIGEGVTRPLLCLPTHLPTCIDPEVFVARLEGLTLEPDDADLLIGMLRLAPFGRKMALARAASLPGLVGAAVRYALGSDEVQSSEWRELWYVAARVRHPHGDDAMIDLHFPGGGLGAAKMPPVTLTKTIGIWYEHQEFFEKLVHRGDTEAIDQIISDQINPVPVEVWCPVGEFYHTEGLNRYSPNCPAIPGYIREAAALYPANQDPYFCMAIEGITVKWQYPDPHYRSECYLEPLLNPDEPFSPHGRIAMLLALSAISPEVRAMAVDVLIQGIEDGRLDELALGEIIGGRLLSTDYRAQDMSKSLEEAACVGPLHAWVIQRGLQLAFTGDASLRPRRLNMILQTFLDLSVAHDLPIDVADCREVLATFKGSSKAGQLAKRLLAHCPKGPVSGRVRAAAVAALLGRLDRLGCAE